MLALEPHDARYFEPGLLASMSMNAAYAIRRLEEAGFTHQRPPAWPR